MSNYTMKYKPTGAHCELEMHIQRWQSAASNRVTDQDERVYVATACRVAHHAIYMLTSGYELVHGNHMPAIAEIIASEKRIAELEAQIVALKEQALWAQYGAEDASNWWNGGRDEYMEKYYPEEYAKEKSEAKQRLDDFNEACLNLI